MSCWSYDNHEWLPLWYDNLVWIDKNMNDNFKKWRCNVGVKLNVGINYE